MVIHKTKRLQKEDLVHYFKAGSSRGMGERIGVEFEQFGLFKESGKPLPFEGEVGIRRLLEILENDFGWQSICSEEGLQLLEREGGRISLEPGGQMELSTPPEITLDEAIRMHERHLCELNHIGRDWGVLWSGLGFQPMAHLHEIASTPKKRYHIMQAYFGHINTCGQEMMKMTSSLQISVDYLNEQDASKKLNLAMRLSPILTAMFANSPFREGRLNGLKSNRSHVWQKTDRARCGLVKEVLDGVNAFSAWTEYALHVPMLFLKRQGVLTGGIGKTFDQFMREGFQGEEATFQDWELHLTTLFPETRLKQWIEIRSVDRQTGQGVYMPLVFIKILMYVPEAKEKALKLLGRFSFNQLQYAMEGAAKSGLDAKLDKFPIADYVYELVRMSHSFGMRKDILSQEEKIHLERLSELFCVTRKCPADDLIARFEAGESLHALIQKTAL